jgi:hypothetical protein
MTSTQRVHQAGFYRMTGGTAPIAVALPGSRADRIGEKFGALYVSRFQAVAKLQRPENGRLCKNLFHRG